jgi:hypothetical protein
MGERTSRAQPAPALDPVAALRAHLSKPVTSRGELEPAVLQAPLTRAQAEVAQQLLVEDWRKRVKAGRGQVLKKGQITVDGKTMRFFYKVYGRKPAGGRSLYISMHGGGAAPKEVNDQQWKNQQQLYQPAEGVYVAPRAPTDTWNMWHEPHIDVLFGRLIADMIALEDVNPNKVYLLGYSAGGDGVYQLAPRMADRFAAAAMMAGHPNDASPVGLRNIGFAIHVGALDADYQRNEVAAQWGKKLAALKTDPWSYQHVVEIHAGKGHWMDRQDAKAIPWLAGFTRTPHPGRISWKQDDVTHTRFYWLAIPPQLAKEGAEVHASYSGQTITIERTDVPVLAVRLNDLMVDLDKPVTVRIGDQVVFQGVVPRTLAALTATFAEREDPAAIYTGQFVVQRPAR